MNTIAHVRELIGIELAEALFQAIAPCSSEDAIVAAEEIRLNWLDLETDLESVYPEEELAAWVSTGMSTLRVYGGKLRDQYEADKWDFPHTCPCDRSWKNYRRSQHK